MSPKGFYKRNAWSKLISGGVDADFPISLNVTRRLFFRKKLPLFETERSKCNFGSLFRTAPKKRGRDPFYVRLTCWCWPYSFLRQKVPFINCALYKKTQSTVSLWIKYSLEVLYRAIKGEKKGFEIRWPTHVEKKKSASLLEKNTIKGPIMTGVFAITDGVGLLVPIFRMQIYTTPILWGIRNKLGLPNCLRGTLTENKTR